MLEDIRYLLQKRPFQPFFVITTGGNRYRVNSGEHAGFNPQGNQVVIWFDDGGMVTIPKLHISAVEKEATRGGGFRRGKTGRRER